MSLAPRSAIVALATSLGLIASCGAGTAGLVANGGGDDGGTNSPGSMSAFTLDNPKVSPTQLHFVLSDPEADPATVELRYQIGGAPAQRLTHISGVSANPTALATSAQGIEYGVQWDFSAESDLPDDGSYVPGIQVFGVVAGGIQEIQVGANAAATGLGNDPPVVIDAVVPSVEVDGIVGVAFELADSSDDIVDVRVEYDIVGDAPDAGWRLARPALLESTPPLALEGVLARSTGSDFEFFWDTDVDLDELEHDVRLRFTAIDPEIEGAPFTTSALHVDNNAAPIAVVHEGLLVTNPDQRRGIPIPFSVNDEEGDEVEVVFQWRRSGESFPALPSSVEEIQAALGDPKLRSELRICSELPRVVEGRVVRVDATTIELPELASTAATLLVDGIIGREIELLRASKRPESVAGDWTGNPLQAPVAAIPIGDGLRAIAVDAPTPGAWRAIELDLATGAVVRELGTGPGLPATAVLDRSGGSVLVASVASFTWRLDRVDIALGTVTPLIAQADVAHPGRIRGIASLGPDAALVTIADQLVRLDWSDPARPRAVTLVEDLATPWGVVLDPLEPGRAYVAEHDAVTPDGIGRIIAVDLDTYEVQPLIAAASDAAGQGGGALPSPRELAFARHGCRLLALCDQPSEGNDPQLRAVDLRAASPNRAYAVSDVFLSGARSIATGPEDLVVVVGGGGAGLYVGGGIEQRRTIVAHDVARRRVEVSPAFSPVPQHGEPWRVAVTHDAPRTSNHGQQVFLWNSADAFEGDVLLRATPIDAEVGLSGVSLAPKQIVSSIGGAETHLEGTSPAGATAPVDIDRDGDLDVVSSNNESLSAHFQTSAGVFDSQPTILSRAPSLLSAVSLEAADLDANGNVDLVTANFSNVLAILWQSAPGVFDVTPTLISIAQFESFISVQVGDFDNDGDLDLLTLGGGRGTFTIYWQSSPGQFDGPPTSITPELPKFVAPTLVRAVDVDSDGDLDLVAANVGETQPVSIYWQSSPGHIDSTPVSLGDVAFISFVAGLVTRDLDADGRLDFVVSNSASLSVYWQSGVGEFEVLPTVIPIGFGGAIMDAPDVDADGDLDLVVTGTVDSLAVYRQIAPREFEPTPRSMHGRSGGVTPYVTTSGDVDGDGDIDLIASELLSPGINVYWNTGGEQLESSPTPLFSGTANGALTAPEFASPGDLDHDGDLDIAVVSPASPGAGVLAVFRQSSPGDFDSTPSVVGAFPTIESPRSVVASDVDGDGNLDLVTANYLSQSLAVFRQLNAGEFSAVPITAYSAYPYGVHAADVDGDGRVDLVSQDNGAPGGVRIQWQTGSGAFDPTPTFVDGSSTAFDRDSLCLVDFDRDGLLDVVTARSDLHVHRQSSPRQFAPPIVVTHAGVSLGRVYADDMDGDGDLDLIGLGPQAVAIFWQASPGVFSVTPSLVGPSGAQVRGVQPVDLDRDGDVDLVVGTYQLAGRVTVYRQTSVGVFEPLPTVIDFAPFAVPGHLRQADLDGDGERDLMVLNPDGFASNPLNLFFGGH